MDTKLHYLLELTPEQMNYLLQAFTKGFDYFDMAHEIAHQKHDVERSKIADEIMDQLQVVEDVLATAMNNPEEYKGVL